MTGSEASVPERCPACGGEVITECHACGEPIESLMGITCRRCGEQLREPVLFGVEIRRKPEPRRPVAVDAPANNVDNESQSS
jgi:predicted amidophosphoribosyltransferase